MSKADAEPEEGLKEISADFVRLIKMVMGAFYKPEEALIIDILLKHPCLREEDLIELLKFDKKSVRSSIEMLKKDKLIKSITKGDKEEVGPGGGTLKFNYYHVSYKVFVDVVKYKLDRMRKKVDQDDQLNQNCQFHLCTACNLRFSDLDVKDLFDPDTGLLLCVHCDTELVEDEVQLKSLQDRSLVSLFNDQTKKFADNLKLIEKIKLSDELLAPEPLKLKIAEKRTRNVPLWQNNRKEYNLYQESSIKVSLEGERERQEEHRKELPVWLAESTVISTNSNDSFTAETSGHHQLGSGGAARVSNIVKDDYISQLIQSEMNASSAPTSGSSSPVNPDEEGEAADEEGEAPDEDEDDEWTVTVQGRPIPLTEVEGEHVEKMTEREKEFYNQKYREYCDSIMM